MSDDETTPEMLARLGTDAMLWAQEFNKTAVKLGYSEMDEGWLIGWFANAIENTDVIRCTRLRAENERLREALNRIAERHIPDQPASDGQDEVDYVRTHYARLQWKAKRAALEGVTEPKK